MAVESIEIEAFDQSDSFFFDNIRSDNNEMRLAAIGMVSDISRKLGPSQTLNVVFPLIRELTKEIDEDVRLALLNELQDFAELLGGDEHIPALLSTLEVFLSSDDTMIRHRGLEVVLGITKSLSEKKLAELFVPFIFQLIGNEWFTARMSAIALWPTAYKCGDKEKQEELLKKLVELANDKIMSVRRVFAMSLPDVFHALPHEEFFQHVFSLAADFFTDSLDSIKMSAIDSFISLMPELKEFTEKYQEVFEHLRELSEDKSWRVRYTLVLKYPELRNLIDAADIEKKLLPDVNNFLDDREPEVRMVAASILSKMFSQDHPEHLATFFNDKMWDRVENLLETCDSDMGSTIVEEIGKISPLLSDKQYKDNFIPFLDKVLKNSNPNVKLKGLSIISCVRKEFNFMESDLIEGLKDMSNNPLWRVRLSLVEHIGLIATSMNFDGTEVGWTSWCNEMLQDEANSVRECTVITILELMKKLSPEWITKFVENRLQFHKNCDNYLLRITTIFLLEHVCLETSSLELKELIIENLLNFAEDPVANVRLNVARVLGVLKESIIVSSHFSEVTSVLLRISTGDIDPDVIYFAEKAYLCYNIL